MREKIKHKWPIIRNWLFEENCEKRWPLEERTKIISEILYLARSRRNALVKDRFSYDFHPDFANLIIDDLAALVLALAHAVERGKRPSDKKRKKKEITQEAKELVGKAELGKEIDAIYSAIRDIGFSGYTVDAEMKWKDAALNRFDDSIAGFNYIKREFLEEDDLYLFSSGKERRDFTGRILKRIVVDHDLGSFGAYLLIKVRKEAKADN